MQFTIPNLKVSAVTHYNCEVCKDKGFVLETMNGYEYAKPCKCKIQADLKADLRRSGLDDKMLERMSFDRYEAVEDFQQRAKSTAYQYSQQAEVKGFYIGGQVGCGKTHLCTAICNEFYKQGKPFRYVIYGEMIRELKALVNDAEDYNRLMNRLCQVKILYIDDMFKGGTSEADIKHFFRLINSRYISQKTTIISSELMLNEVMAIDEAIGSRIKQMCGKFVLNIAKVRERNYRLKVVV